MIAKLDDPEQKFKCASRAHDSVTYVPPIDIQFYNMKHQSPKNEVYIQFTAAQFQNMNRPRVVNYFSSFIQESGNTYKSSVNTIKERNNFDLFTV